MARFMDMWVAMKIGHHGQPGQFGWAQQDEKVWGHMKGQGSVGDKALMVGGPQWTQSLEDGRGSSVCCSGLGPGWAWWAGQV